MLSHNFFQNTNEMISEKYPECILFGRSYSVTIFFRDLLNAKENWRIKNFWFVNTFQHVFTAGLIEGLTIWRGNAIIQGIFLEHVLLLFWPKPKTLAFIGLAQRKSLLWNHTWFFCAHMKKRVNNSKETELYLAVRIWCHGKGRG